MKDSARVASGSVLSKSMLTVTCASIVACMGHFGVGTRGDPVSTGVSYDSRRVWDTTNILTIRQVVLGDMYQ